MRLKVDENLPEDLARLFAIRAGINGLHLARSRPSPGLRPPSPRKRGEGTTRQGAFAPLAGRRWRAAPDEGCHARLTEGHWGWDVKFGAWAHDSTHTSAYRTGGGTSDVRRPRTLGLCITKK